MDSTTAPGTSSATPPPAPSTAAPAPATAAGPRKVLHSKRSFGTKHSLAHSRPVLDSPAYDASEEDNDPLTDDGGPGISVHITPAARPARSSTAASTTLATRNNSALPGSHLKEVILTPTETSNTTDPAQSAGVSTKPPPPLTRGARQMQMRN